MKTSIETSPLQIVSGVQTVDNYPYGFILKTTCTFQVEFKKNKGYRAVTQTVNPKNGRLNKPKTGVYYTFAYMFKNDNGNINFDGLYIRGFEDVEKFIKILSENEFTFSDEESQEFWATIITAIRASLRYMRRKEGATNEEIIEASKAKQLVHAYAQHWDINEIKNIGFTLENIKALTL